MRRKGFYSLVGALLLGGLGIWGITWFQDEWAFRERRHILSGMLLVCKLYAGDHDGARPPDLRAVFPKYINSPLYLFYATHDVEYFPGATDYTNPGTVLIREKRLDARGRQLEGHVDCAVVLTPAAPPPTRSP